MKKITSTTKNVFISDDFDDTGEVWVGDYIWLFFDKKANTFPSTFFNHLNMIKSKSVYLVEEATTEEEIIFNKLKNSNKLDKKDEEYLKAHYLVE